MKKEWHCTWKTKAQMAKREGNENGLKVSKFEKISYLLITEFVGRLRYIAEGQ